MEGKKKKYMGNEGTHAKKKKKNWWSIKQKANNDDGTKDRTRNCVMWYDLEESSVFVAVACLGA